MSKLLARKKTKEKYELHQQAQTAGGDQLVSKPAAESCECDQAWGVFP